jgi:imidazolonepropionase-like amidohydrolase/Tol biopolymer transport system component
LLLAGCTPTTTTTIEFEVTEGTYLNFDLSPNGQSMVFDLLGQLWLMPVEGGRALPFTNAVRDTAHDLSPTFSPDGKWVAFSSARPGGGSQALWLKSIDEDEVRLLTERQSTQALGQPIGAAWAPDGGSIAVGMGTAIQIYDMETNAAGAVKIEGIPARGLRDPTWSPDGAQLAFWNGFRDGARCWEVDPHGGQAVAIAFLEGACRSPQYAPDGDRFAFLAPDPDGELQVWVANYDAAEPVKLTDHKYLSSYRWSPSGEEIFFSAAGRLWRIPAAGGTAVEIPFSATIRFERNRPSLPPLEIPDFGTDARARGHMGLSISPDGTQIGMIALGKLWVFPVGGQPREVATLPPLAQGLAWSPDARAIAWSAGPGGSEDLFVTEVRTGQTRRLTSLPGREERPSWSHDGTSIAFVHWQKPTLNTPPWDWSDAFAHVRVIPTSAESVEIVDSTLDLGEVRAWTHPWYGNGQEVASWAPNSEGVLVFRDGSLTGMNAFPLSIRAEVRRLDGETRTFSLPGAASFVRWGADSSIIYVKNAALWRGRLEADSLVEEQLSDEPALYPSVARDGSVLYVSADGLRIRRPDATVEALGWPLGYRTTQAPRSLLLENVSVIDGLGTAPSSLNDVLITTGRIARIAPAGQLPVGSDVEVLDGEGRTVLPGMIDLHVHLHRSEFVSGSLFFGITTIRDMGSSIARLGGLRDAVEAGVMPGARVVLGGFQFVPGHEHGFVTDFGVRDQEPGIYRSLVIARAYGAQFAKLYWPWTLPAGVRLVREAHELGMRVTGHCVSSLPLVAAGIDGKEHLGPAAGCSNGPGGVWGEDLVRLFETTGMAVVPTLEIRHNAYFPAMLEDAEIAASMTPALRWWIQQLAPARVRRMNLQEPTVAHKAAQRLRGTDVVIAAGNDGPVPGSLHWELEGMVLAGFSPMEAIVAATSSAALVLGAEADIGSVEVGNLADLVILDADPLEDIRNTRRIWRVIKGGQIVDREALLERN